MQPRRVSHDEARSRANAPTYSVRINTVEEAEYAPGQILPPIGRRATDTGTAPRRSFGDLDGYSYMRSASSAGVGPETDRRRISEGREARRSSISEAEDNFNSVDTSHSGRSIVRKAFERDHGTFLSSYVKHEDEILDLLDILEDHTAAQYRGLLSSARTFLPEILAQSICDHRSLDNRRIIVKRTEGAVVFSDASGFTALTSRLEKYDDGAEKLSTCLNHFFTPLIGMLNAYRGDVIKFSGDALTVLFPVSEDEDFIHTCGSPSCSHGPLELACLRASACCIEIHKRLHNFDTGEGDVRLTLHIGIGAGEVTVLQVGSLQKRYEYVMAGEPLQQIAVAEPLAGSGETVLSPECWKQVSSFVVEGEPIKDYPDFHRLVGLDTTRHTYPTVKQAAQQISRHCAHSAAVPESRAELEKQLRISMRFIPRSVAKHFMTSSLRGINEMRTVSIMFMSVSGVDVSTDWGAVKAQELLSVMQGLCYNEEGSLNKFMVDDKGCVLLWVWGLPPLVHSDDPARAVSASLDMLPALQAMGLAGKIGVTTGRVYCGIVGSDTRREYTVMGDTVNMSARLMANADVNTILVDETTFKRTEAEGKATFEKLTPIQVKGKEGKFQVYRPTDRKRLIHLGEPSSSEQVKDVGAPALLTARLNGREEQVQVPMGWSPRTMALGSKSPLSEMKNWRYLSKVHDLLDERFEIGGGPILLIGDSGCGKEELAETVIKRCLEAEGMLPVFATMQMRSTERWAAVRELLWNLLALLHDPGALAAQGGAPPSDARLAEMLALETLTSEESDAIRLLDTAEEVPTSSNMNMVHTSSMSGASSAAGSTTLSRMMGSSDALNDGTSAGNGRVSALTRGGGASMPMNGRSSRVGHTETQAGVRPSVLSVSVDPFMSAAPSTASLLVHSSSTMVARTHTPEKALCELACKLMQRLLLQERVVLTLRCWRGTTLSRCDTSAFWSLVNRIGQLARQQPPGRMAVLVVARSLPEDGDVLNEVPGGAPPDLVKRSPTSRSGKPGMSLLAARSTVKMEGLTDDEAFTFAGMLLGGPETRLIVPSKLRRFLRSVALNVPRHIEEALRELQVEGAIRVTPDAVEVLKDLEDPQAVNVSAWMHTHMVGSIVSQVEMMGPEAQRVIKMATVFEGPFSAFDVAVANRMHRPSSDILAFQDAVQLLLSCEWLCHHGKFLVRHYGEIEDQQTENMPRWCIADQLIRRVVGASLLRSQRIQVKRIVLMARALNVHLPLRMRLKWQQREEMFGRPSKAEKLRQQRRREVDSAAPGQGLMELQAPDITTQSLDGSAPLGLPSSCIVLPTTVRWRPGSLYEDLQMTSMRGRRDTFTTTSSFGFGGGAGARGSRSSFTLDSMSTNRTDLQQNYMLVPEDSEWDQMMAVAAGSEMSPADCGHLSDWVHLMCHAGQTERVAMLLEKGAPASLCDQQGRTPLHWSCARGDVDTVRVLVESAADPLAEASRSEGLLTPLELAAQQGHVAIVKYLVDECEALSLAPPGSKLRSRDHWKSSLVSVEVQAPMPTPKLVSDSMARVQLETVNLRRNQALAYLQDATMQKDFDPTGSAGSVQSLGTNPSTYPGSPVSEYKKASLRRCLHARSTVGVMFCSSLLAILAPDLWVLADGSQRSIDIVLTCLLVLSVGHIVAMIAQDRGYLKTTLFVLDLIGTGAIVFDISWMFGPSHDETMLVDQPLDGRSGSFNVVLFRAARGANIGARLAGYSWLTKLANLLCICFISGPGSRPESADFKGIVVFRKALMKAVSTNVALLTLSLVVTAPLLNFLLVEDADYSMLAWVMILSTYYNSTAGQGLHASSLWDRELALFQEFYEPRTYGPYSLCSSEWSGAAPPPAGCPANSTLLWGDSGFERFAAPDAGASRLSVKAGGLTALFDFTIARKTEAEMNMGLMIFVIFSMAITTFFLARSISVIVLRPLSSMLASVTEIAKPILGDSRIAVDDDYSPGGGGDDEILTLERLVHKLGKIAGIAAEMSGKHSIETRDLDDAGRGILELINSQKSIEASFSPSTSRVISSSSMSGGSVPHWQCDPLPDEEARGTLRRLKLDWNEMDSWDLNSRQMEPSVQMSMTGWILLQNAGTFGDVMLVPEVAVKFLQTLSNEYRPENPFHNWSHAVDVHHVVWRMMLVSSAHHFLTGTDQFCLLVSAISHDVGHPGVNNQFLVETGSDLAVRYNDRSPLENMHCSLMFQIASSTPGANVFDGLKRSDFFESRRTCIEAILATDMMHHFEILKESEMLYQMNADALASQDGRRSFRDREAKQKAMNLLLHAADISNPCRPWEVCREWAFACLDEFFNQGDREKDLGIPVQMLNDRSKVNRPFSQIGFLEFMIVPLQVGLVKLFPSLYGLTENLQANLRGWHEVWFQEVAPAEDEAEKVATRIERVCAALDLVLPKKATPRSCDQDDAPSHQPPQPLSSV